MNSYSQILETLKAEQRFRCIPHLDSKRDWLDLCSNDYMGLSADSAELRHQFDNLFPNISFSASASRLLQVNQDSHLCLEQLLENLYGKPALLFNSGYHANTGITSALNIPGTLFVSDKLIHASMIDGLRCGRCEMKRFRHNDMQALRTILDKEYGNYERIIVMVESIYSMDGDLAPLQELVELKSEFPHLILYVDEAHAFGVRGTRGLGLCEELNLNDKIDIIVGTLGKAAYSMGAFVTCSDMMKDYLINSARSFIFSTALPPANIAWSLLTINKLTGMEDKRVHLKELSKYFRTRLASLGHSIPLDDTPIIPLLTGDASKAIALSSQLREKGILTLPIRRPTVPVGGERIRFSLNTNLTYKQIDFVCSELEKLCN